MKKILFFGLLCCMTLLLGGCVMARMFQQIFYNAEEDSFTIQTNFKRITAVSESDQNHLKTLYAIRNELIIMPQALGGESYRILNDSQVVKYPLGYPPQKTDTPITLPFRTDGFKILPGEFKLFEEKNWPHVDVDDETYLTFTHHTVIPGKVVDQWLTWVTPIANAKILEGVTLILTHPGTGKVRSPRPAEISWKDFLSELNSKGKLPSTCPFSSESLEKIAAAAKAEKLMFVREVGELSVRIPLTREDSEGFVECVNYFIDHPEKRENYCENRAEITPKGVLWILNLGTFGKPGKTTFDPTDGPKTDSTIQMLREAGIPILPVL